MENEIWVVDAFTTQPYCGNPAAVVFDAGALPAHLMQAVGRETNLSETAFITNVDSESQEYHVRFFGPRREVPFGGHPTLASAFALGIRYGWLKQGRATSIVQHCPAGRIPLEVTWPDARPLLTMRQASPRIAAVDIDRAAAAATLGCECDQLLDRPVANVSTGLPWLIVPLASAAAIEGIVPNHEAIARLSREHRVTGITAFALRSEGDELWARVRSFAPEHGVPEDPVCGSGNGAVGAYLAEYLLPQANDIRYRVQQGAELQRPGIVLVRVWRDGGPAVVTVGGEAVVVMRGRLHHEAGALPWEAKA